MARRIKVAVTGASGRTGRLVVQRLLCEPERYHPVAVVRSRRAADDMERMFSEAATAAAAARGGEQDDDDSAAAPAGSVHILDFCAGLDLDTREEEDDGHPDRISDAERRLRDEAFRGCRALVVASSSVAEPKAWASLASAAHVGVSRLLGKVLPGRLASRNAAFVPVATWKGGQTPREVDWLGTRRLFRAFFAAVAAADEEEEAAEQARACGGGGGGGSKGRGGGGGGGGGHIVLISSAGGCDPHHFLNRIAEGEVLNWKRRAEQELVRMCGGGGGGSAAGGGKGGKGGGGGPSSSYSLSPSSSTTVTYTILHPNHLIDGGAGGPKSPTPASTLAALARAASADNAANHANANNSNNANPAILGFFDPRRSRLLLDVDDALQRPHWSRRPRVPRGALAELSVQCVALARPAGGGGGGSGVASSSSPSSSSSWCTWEEEEGERGASNAAAAPLLPAPARNRSIDVGVEAKTKKAEGQDDARGAEAAAASPPAMTRLFASMLRAMPRDCDYSLNDRTGGGLQWACSPCGAVVGPQCL
jgi:uncharacterized protein YbjT (DUF2867 family)